MFIQLKKLKTSGFCCIQGEVARACEGRAPWVAVKGKLLDKDGVMPYHARAVFRLDYIATVRAPLFFSPCPVYVLRICIKT